MSTLSRISLPPPPDSKRTCSMYAVTGASGRLGRLVLKLLVEKIPPTQIVALTRDPRKLADYAAKGVTVRHCDFDVPETLPPSLTGVDRLLLISGDQIGQRERQHDIAIEAAKLAGVSFIAYTSVLHADTCTLGLAAEHRATEATLRASGLNYALLRHGWYTENTTANAAREIDGGTVTGSAGYGRQSTATRADFAAGDVAVLLDSRVEKGTFELAGDGGYTMSEYAAILAEVSGKAVRYEDLSEDDYRERLQQAGLPKFVAALLSTASAHSAKSIMFDDSRTLSRLIGRPTTDLRTSVVQALSPAKNGPLDGVVFKGLHKE